ncbi:hypothetical protein EDF46_2236 [Frondihabitans sp. PhB188]|uniref:thioredoxin domain-containing protein n=1 Tax=Frondihabitans sp. PhB188 TaxID=2485200 RepID=UPI000F4719F3|nr:DUF255 domain-containing protein [Frondihabitans sp. PhB188]ROQ38596.1 hypothetical protein EDF46_2236 [Frondihabitans sp. PhB188]
MPNRLANAISPYLRSHADNPVDWREWGADAFDEAARRDVPVLVSIGYSTCHWCHVMARETFSDEVVAAFVNERFVAVKVDREEHPDVDAAYLAAAGAFTESLGWPLTVFVTPTGRAFYAGTYYPPVPVQGHPSFRQVLDAVLDAWTDRRDEVDRNAADIAAALRAASAPQGAGTPPTPADLDRVVAQLAAAQDPVSGGFGRAPKFPIAPVQLLLLDLAAGGSAEAGALVSRTLGAMAASPLRDAVEGGFFRYAVRHDWHEPHYERMLYDNALLLDAYSRLGDVATAAGVAEFLRAVLQREEGGFGSAQDSESPLGEGGYYALSAAERAKEVAPKVDEKVLAGWNGLAIGALAEAGALHGRTDWVELARRAADRMLRTHRQNDGTLRRVATERGASDAVATLEDYGMLADGLLRLALASGQESYAVAGRGLVEACLVDDDRVFAAPGEGDPVLAAQGLGLRADPSEGAYPSGLSAAASAALTLSQLSHSPRLREAAARAIGSIAAQAVQNPAAFGASLSVAAALAAPAEQLVVVADALGEVAAVARDARRPGRVVGVVTPAQSARWAAAGFDLFESRDARPGADETAYLCRDFVCALPVTTAAALAADLATSSSGSSSAVR